MYIRSFSKPLYIKDLFFQPKKGIPKIYKKAHHMSNADDWINAMKLDLQCLTEPSTWRLARFSKEWKIISTKWFMT